MATGIIEVFAKAGIPVLYVARGDDKVARVRTNLERSLDKGVARGKLTQEARDAALAIVSGTTQLDDLADKSVSLFVNVDSLPEIDAEIARHYVGLIKRVEVVTGGASAAYGSDAVSGVVNFILDSTFTGLKGEASGGISGKSDNAAQALSLAWGTKFAGDRGHLVFSVDYSNSEGIVTGENRAWNRQHVDIIPNATPTDGRPQNLWRAGVTGAQFSEGGLIYAGPLRGIQFLPGGATAPNQLSMKLLRNEPASAKRLVSGPSIRIELSITPSSTLPWMRSVRGSRVSTSMMPPILRPYREEKLPG